MVTVIVPVYNAAPYIRSCLLSLALQTYEDFEVILVDDGSDDGSIEIIWDWIHDKPRYRLIVRDRPPKGAGTCRNIGLELATGSYIMFLDADDLLASCCLEERVAYMEQRPELDFAVFQMKCFGNADRLMTLHKPDYLQAFVRLDLPWTITGPFWRTTFIQHRLHFDERFPRLEDPDLHIQALLKHPTFAVEAGKAPDCFYRQQRSAADHLGMEWKRWQVFMIFIEKYAPIFHRHPDFSGWWHRPFLMCANIFLRRYVMPEKRPLLQLLDTLRQLGEVSLFRYIVIFFTLQVGPSSPMPFRAILIRLAMFTLSPSLYRKEFTSRFGI